ncbi:MAG: hypothetical protein PHQ50_06470 [Eubacteriales bacterium]|nr:hypothetical protein [Eubacteriales bacterium]
MNIIFGIFGLMEIIFVWGSFATAVVFIVVIVRKMRESAISIKEGFTLLVSGVYAIAFLTFKILQPELFADVFSVIFMLFFVISTQQIKFEDRKVGRRWWDQ